MKVTVCRTRMIMEGNFCSYDVWIKPENMTPTQREECCNWIIHNGIKYASFSQEYRVYPKDATLAKRIELYEWYERQQPYVEANIVRKVCPEITMDKLPVLWIEVPPGTGSGIWEVEI